MRASWPGGMGYPTHALILIVLLCCCATSLYFTFYKQHQANRTHIMPIELKTVLITGCSEGGLGAALALAFQEQGFHVFATLRNPAKAGSLTGKHGTNIDVLPLDTTSKESIHACLEIVKKKTNKLDVLVNNAGIGKTMPLLHMSIDEAKAIYEVNVWGTLGLVQAFAPLLFESKKGVIVNICSIVGASNLAWQGKPFREQAFSGRSKVCYGRLTGRDMQEPIIAPRLQRR